MQSDLTAAERRARAGSGLTSRLLLSYVEREGAPGAVARVLERASLTELEAALRVESTWFSYEEKIALWTAAEQELGDERVAVRVGASVLDFSVADGLKRALRALGSPELVLRNVARTNAKFNYAHSLEVLEARREHARLRYADVSGAGYHRYDCDYTRGLLSTIPQLFGLPPARVEHPVCGAYGDGCCEFELSWDAGLHHLRRAALVVGGASSALAVAGFVAVQPLLPAAGAVAVLGGAGLTRRAFRELRHRARTLEGRVAEQDEATERLSASLTGLSADLSPDEVLADVARRAGEVVGAAHHALLLTSDDELRADRHSGVPAAALAAVERWAAAHREALAEGPMLVDDVGAVPALSCLAVDRDVPLGSICVAPLLFRDELLGALVAFSHGSMAFLPHESAALGAYAAQAAIALSNARLVERLERQAAEDPLTGLANHRAFHRACMTEFARAEREGDCISIVALDLDHFKSINDVHGHVYGDDVLRDTADALRASVRPHDTVARVGGEEFAMLLPGTDAAGAYDVAERARAAIARVPVRDRTLSSSAGVATHPSSGEAVERLFQLADHALYDAKDRGRNRTVEHGRDPDADAAAAAATVRGSVVRREIATLFEPGGIEVVFQPIVVLSTGRVICHEALARFPGLPERPIPDVFHEAHRTGLGPQLEALAVRRALEQPGRPPGTLLSVNLSVTAMCSAEVWGAMPSDLSALVVEITEDELFRGGPQLERALARLREQGARIALDDAGAGYAGLQQLIRVRPDIVKIDRSLVAGVAHDPARAALLGAFATFAAQTGGALCAEGIEEPDDLRAIADLDIAYGQGYLLGRPGAEFAASSCEPARAATSPLRAGLRVLDVAARHQALSLGGSVPERLASIIADVANAERVDLWRLDRRAGRLVALRAGSVEPGTRVPLAEVPARAHVVTSGEAGQVLRSDLEADAAERRALAHGAYGGVLLVPVEDAGVMLGVVACYRRAGRPWSGEVAARVRTCAAPLAAVLAGGVADERAA